MLEVSFVMFKQDAVKRGLVGELTSRLERKGLRMLATRILIPTKAQMALHYGEHADKPFYTELVSWSLQGPSQIMVWCGPEAVKLIRGLMGQNLHDGPGTIRGDYATTIRQNVMHASSSLPDALREINLWWTELDIWQLKPQMFTPSYSIGQADMSPVTHLQWDLTTRLSIPVFVGPGGSGKSTIVKQLTEYNPEFVACISTTTRLPREGEMDHQHYHFVSSQGIFIDNRVQEGDFLECAKYGDSWYGTTYSELERIRAKGKTPVLIVDTQGHQQLVRNRAANLLFKFYYIFVRPTGDNETVCKILHDRMSQRGDIVEQVLKREAQVDRELAYYNDNCEKFDKLLYNDFERIPEHATGLGKVISDILSVLT